MHIADKMGQITHNTLAVLEQKKREKLARGERVINLSAGTPDLPPDVHVMQALSKAALDPENYKYAISDYCELLQSAVKWYSTRYNVDLTTEQIMAVYGSQEGISHVAIPFCNAGDTILVPNPCYPIFEFGPKMLAGTHIKYMPLERKNNYLIDLNAIDSATAKKAKMMIVSYPNNPTTACAGDDFYSDLVSFAKKYNIIVIHDNAYSELVLNGGKRSSFLQTKGAMDIGIEFNSLSKSYNLTGMRASFVLGNKELIKNFKKFRSQIDYGQFPAVQKAVIAALTGSQDILERNRKIYRRRRDVFTNSLIRIGWEVPECDSTMFCWYPLPNSRTDDVEFVFELMEKTGIIAVPGSSFGTLGKGFVRFALVRDESVLSEAAELIMMSGIIK